ncbi:hypothetical protein NQZ68_027620 [Dissostichus eleginoides]|nr:hypothetical protein NQZ68_027620 [Dissostichus eleginoides]
MERTRWLSGTEAPNSPLFLAAVERYRKNKVPKRRDIRGLRDKAGEMRGAVAGLCLQKIKALQDGRMMDRRASCRADLGFIPIPIISMTDHMGEHTCK